MTGLLDRDAVAGARAMAEAARVHKEPTPQNLQAEATNGNADVLFAAVGNHRQCIFGVAFGYDAVPVATGYIQIFVDENISLNIPVTNGGAGYFPVGRQSNKGGTLRIRLTAGGQAIDGHVAVLNHWLEE